MESPGTFCWKIYAALFRFRFFVLHVLYPPGTVNLRVWNKVCFLEPTGVNPNLFQSTCEPLFWSDWITCKWINFYCKHNNHISYRSFGLKIYIWKKILKKTVLYHFETCCNLRTLKKQIARAFSSALPGPGYQTKQSGDPSRPQHTS